jgi:transmembrane sensor
MNRINILLEKYTSRLSTEQEEEELYQLIAAEENEAAIKAWLMEVMEIEATAEIDKGKWDGVLKQILREAGGEWSVVSEGEEAGSGEWSVVSGEKEGGKIKRLTIWKRVAVAASLVGVLMVGYWLIKDKTTDDGQQTTVVKVNDVSAPDKNRASIKLADGRIVYLDSMGNGELAMVNGIKINKTEDGKIEYSGGSSVVGGELQYNTLSNPRGSKVINMTLVDGSKVWLNAGSSITYPVAFVGNERKVDVTGEAYFEIQSSVVSGESGVKRPFIVSKGDVSVTVLGTHFNVNAYDDESAIRVTLLEGKVNVSTKYDVRGTMIKPGEQASVVNRETSVVRGVNIEQVMAWKNGRFEFKGTNIETIMRQVEKWYDVDVQFEDKINYNFVADINRDVPVSELLRLLELTNLVHFKVEGNKIIVSK